MASNMTPPSPSPILSNNNRLQKILQIQSQNLQKLEALKSKKRGSKEQEYMTFSNLQMKYSKNQDSSINTVNDTFNTMEAH